MIIGLLLFAIAAVPLVIMPKEWPAWLLLYTTFAAPLLLVNPRRQPRLILAIWATLLFHHYIAIHNAHIATVFGAADDAHEFQSVAESLAATGDLKFELGSRLYGQFLGLLYTLFGASHLFGEETSVLAHALACGVLVRFMDLLKIERHRVACILLFGFLPSAALYRSITVREAWQILFFMGGVYQLLRFRITASPFALMAGAAMMVLMGTLHNGLILFALAVIPYALTFRLGLKTSLSLQRLLGLGLVAAVVVGLGAAVGTRAFQTEALEHVTDGRALEYADNYRKRSSHEARAAYDAKLDTSSLPRFALSVPKVFFYFMAAPMPWQVRTPVDVYGFGESLLRLLLIFFAVKAWRRPPEGANAQIPGFLLSLYFMLSFLWSLGTINYGTAIRHHIVGLWIIILLGLPPLLDKFRALSRVKVKA